ncbi:MAG TPA: tetratricopeptide repeat protein [Terriglobia bacterium]
MKKLLGLLAILTLTSVPQASASQTRTILVLPFENQSANSDLGWISEAFAEVLSRRLAGPGRYVLDREERNAAYQQLGIPAATPLTLASTYKVAQTLGVDWAVVGNFRVAGDQLTAVCQLLEVHSLKLTPRLEATGALADLLDVQTRLAWRLLATHDPDFTAGAEDDFARRFPALRLDAFENYIRGLLAADDETRVHFFREADRIDPSDHGAAFQLGLYYFDHKQYAESATWLHKLTPSDPDYPQSVFTLGVDEYFTGENTKSEQAFAALEKQIPLDEVTNNLSVAQARRGDYQDALAGFERAYQGDPLDPDFSFNLAATLWRLKKYGEAAKALESGLSQNDDDSEAHILLALVFGKLQNSTGEQGETRWLLAHHQDLELHQDFVPELRIKKHYDGKAFGLLAVMLHNTEEARLSRESPEQHAEAHISEGKKLLAAGSLAEAERALDEADTLIPQSSEVHLVLGQVYEAEGRHQEAAEEFKTSLQLDNNAVTHLWLGRVYLSMNQAALAVEQGRAALALDPGSAEAERLVDDANAHERGGNGRRTP